MNSIYQNIVSAKSNGKKLLAVLIDPDKMLIQNVEHIIAKVNQSVATHIFVGGSEVSEGLTERLVFEIKKHTKIPVVLFPGDVVQISNNFRSKS